MPGKTTPDCICSPVFCITPGPKFALSGFVSLFYAQAFEALIRYCDENEGTHHLPTHVRFL